mmetsp:Transcript_4805/g.11824  ORF Transcript_4805/g.11824 Transcript_4805/m.11824 type:complete len:226 (+) Transcript_4805:232-909(+)
MSSADEDIKTAASAEADGKRMASTTAEDMEAPSAEDGEREKMSAADQIEYVPAYMAEENPPIVEFADPRNTIMRLLCCHPVVCAWQGCDKPMHNWLTCFCCCFFTLCCWKPGPRQKKFKPLGQEKKVCCSCCECHPEALCHRLFCAWEAVYAWQGCDSWCDACILIPLATIGWSIPFGFLPSGIYAVFCWEPPPRQKVLGGTTTKPMVGKPVAANYGTARTRRSR